MKKLQFAPKTSDYFTQIVYFCQEFMLSINLFNISKK